MVFHFFCIDGDFVYVVFIYICFLVLGRFGVGVFVSGRFSLGGGEVASVLTLFIINKSLFAYQKNKLFTLL